jgi:hypothetical protein
VRDLVERDLRLPGRPLGHGCLCSRQIVPGERRRLRGEAEAAQKRCAVFARVVCRRGGCADAPDERFDRVVVPCEAERRRLDHDQ